MKKAVSLVFIFLLLGAVFVWRLCLGSEKKLSFSRETPFLVLFEILVDSQSQKLQSVPYLFNFVEQAPFDRVLERITKKKFGDWIDRKTSPIQPERFQGYHTGVDLEIFPEELNKDIVVLAICDGKIELAKMANGYGGVVVQSCRQEGRPITVIYGHLKLASVKAKVGDLINKGEEIGILGADKSRETDGERKHLHLAIHKGKEINLLGYVNVKDDLSNWLNPCDFLKKNC